MRAWREPLVLPTYRIGPPERNPLFRTNRIYQGAQGRIYPYPMLDRLTDAPVPRSWEALWLENEYVRVCLLPEIGGRIFSALDRTNGYDIFHRHAVIKPALIGMLGAWISGGVEWNVLHHHRATTFLPVDAILERNPDGSATVRVGEIELRQRMRWSLGVTVRPGRSLIEVDVRIANRTPHAHSMLFFANAAVQANDRYQVIFPPDTTMAVFHGKNQFSGWPVSHEVFNGVDYTAGVDASWWHSHPAGTSFFAWNYTDDFFAGYDHGRDAGVVHVADHHVMPGKKFFEFGNGPEGRMWDTMLSDDRLPYLELMVGAYSDNQPDYSWLAPYETRTFSSAWYPLRGIGGVTHATREAALNLCRAPDGSLLAGCLLTRAERGARVLLRSGEAVIAERRLDLGPDRPLRLQLPWPAGAAPEDLELSVAAADGRLIARYRPPRPSAAAFPPIVTAPPQPKDAATNEDLYLYGSRLEQFHNPVLEPEPWYEEAVRRDPGDTRALVALAQRDLKCARFAEAERRLRTALARLTRHHTSPREPGAWYWLGLALRAQGRLDEAVDALHRAAWGYPWRHAAGVQLAEIASCRGDPENALALIDAAIAMDALDLRARALRAALLRALGRHREAREAAAAAVAADPLDHLARNELALALRALGKRAAARGELARLAALMRGEAATHLEIASDYHAVGMTAEALEVLERLAAPHPLALYYRGFLEAARGRAEEARRLTRQASSLPTDLVFPHQAEMLAVLEAAAAADPGDARPPYYLGTLLYDWQPGRAIGLWERARSLDAGHATTHRNLAFGYARHAGDAVQALHSIDTAISLDPSDPRYLLEADQWAELAGESAERRLDRMLKHRDTAARHDASLVREIALLVMVGRYDEAIAGLDGHHFHAWEGGEELHDVHVDAHLLRARASMASGRPDGARVDVEAALEYPENQELGRPHRGGRFAQIHHQQALVLTALGDPQGARAAFEEAASAKCPTPEMLYFRALAERALGRTAEADRTASELRAAAERALLPWSDVEGFFAKFTEVRSERVRVAHGRYLLGLAAGLAGDRAEARRELAEALRLRPSHLWAAVMREEFA